MTPPPAQCSAAPRTPSPPPTWSLPTTTPADAAAGPPAPVAPRASAPALRLASVAQVAIAPAVDPAPAPAEEILHSFKAFALFSVAKLLC
ncbi:hypothetical protein CF326_g4788 [Tilletia indica]|nr:hypothetical protein CF326_g4788 [Tilletia indica]